MGNAFRILFGLSARVREQQGQAQCLTPDVSAYSVCTMASGERYLYNMILVKKGSLRTY